MSLKYEHVIQGTTGDGHKLALAVGAKAVDLDDVQVASPTGHVTHPPFRRQMCSCTPPGP